MVFIILFATVHLIVYIVSLSTCLIETMYLTYYKFAVRCVCFILCIHKAIYYFECGVVCPASYISSQKGLFFLRRGEFKILNPHCPLSMEVAKSFNNMREISNDE